MLTARDGLCSGLMPQCEWVPHDSDVDITTDCPFGIAVTAPSSSTQRSTGSTVQAPEEFFLQFCTNGELAGENLRRM